MANWYDNARLVTGLGDALVEAEVLTETDEFKAFLKTPQRYDDYFDAWKEAGYPTSEDDNGWDDFVNAMESDEEDEEVEEP